MSVHLLVTVCTVAFYCQNVPVCFHKCIIVLLLKSTMCLHASLVGWLFCSCRTISNTKSSWVLGFALIGDTLEFWAHIGNDNCSMCLQPLEQYDKVARSMLQEFRTLHSWRAQACILWNSANADNSNLGSWHENHVDISFVHIMQWLLLFQSQRMWSHSSLHEHPVERFSEDCPKIRQNSTFGVQCKQEFNMLDLMIATWHHLWHSTIQPKHIKNIYCIYSIMQWMGHSSWWSASIEVHYLKQGRMVLQQYLQPFGILYSQHSHFSGWQQKAHAIIVCGECGNNINSWSTPARAQNDWKCAMATTSIRTKPNHKLCST